MQLSLKRKRAKRHAGLSWSPHSQAEILLGEPSCDSRDSREVTVVLADLQEICPLEVAGNHRPGAGKAACRAVSPQRQSATKPSQGSSFQQKCVNNWISMCRNPQTPSQNTALIHTKSFQSCPALCDLMDCSPPGSSVHGILQARIPEWVAMLSSRESS